MHRLHLLGRIDLRDAQGAEVRAVLAQPKRLALLACLAFAGGKGARRRDALLALFWPELDQDHARKALNKAVHFLRGALGEEVIVSRGDEDLAVDRGRLWCDAVAFLEAVDRSRPAEALELYGGELLPAFHLNDVPAFEEWLEHERADLRRRAADAARRMAEQFGREGQLGSAVAIARRALELSDADERAVRHLLELLDQVGDRAAALREYESFARRLALEYGAEPAAETQTLIRRIRARAEARGPADTRIEEPGPIAAALNAPPRLERSTGPASRNRVLPRGSRRMWTLIGTGTMAVGIGAMLALRLRPLPVYVPTRVVVAPLENQTGDASVADLARQLMATLPDAIAREGVGEPVPAAMVRDLLARATGSPGRVAEWLARETGAGLQLRGVCSRAAAGTTCQVDLLRMPAKVLRMSVSATGDPAQPAFGAELTERLLVALFLQRTWGDRVIWRGEYVPRSLAAVRAFKQAWDNEEWHLLAEAARLDTGWAEPVGWAAHDSSYVVAESVYARLARRPGLLEGERDAVAFARAGLRREAEKAFELARRRFAVNPEWWFAFLTYWAGVTDRAATTIAVSSYADSAVGPRKRQLLLAYGRRATALHHLGRYKEQLALAHELRRRFPTEELEHRSIELTALVGLGEVDSVRQRLSEWEATPEPVITHEAVGPQWVGSRAYIAAVELMAHGHQAEGRELLAATLPLYRRLREAGEYHIELVEILLVTGQLEEARVIALHDLRTFKSLRDSLAVLAILGGIAAREGKLDDAASYDRLLSAAGKRPGFAGGTAALARAYVATWLGDREGAVRLLEEARGYGLAEHRFVHRDPIFAALRDYPPFQRFLKSRD